MSDFALLWFGGIGWQTRMGDIGWVYVTEAILVIILIKLVIDIRRI